jgi:hypothetical protein
VKRLYQVFKLSSPLRFIVPILLLTALLSSCSTPESTQIPDNNLTVTLIADGQTQNIKLPAGTTVKQVLTGANITLGNLDKVDPQAFIKITDGVVVKVIRGREVFKTENSVIAFERQTVRNESLPQGETRLLQPGINGTQEIIYRYYYEDNLLVNTSISKTATIQAAIPEIVMVGVQAPFVPLPIPGKLIYISNGNAWLMQGSTSKRTPLVTTGDLDGRVLKLSGDGSWLLYTRKSPKSPDQEINSLWTLNIDDPKAQPIDLKTRNIIHFADWDPTTVSTLRVLYSTVEPRTASPGWQANNDLFRMIVGKNGNLGVREKIIEANTGGVYGWWGTNFSWSPTGTLLSYSRPDEVGIVSFKNKTLQPLLSILPFQTRSDWALIPGLGWGADSRTLYVVTHAPPPGMVNPEESPNFDLSAISLDFDGSLRIIQQSGMFAYPASSSPRQNGDERSYYVSYLQALSPEQSEASGYRLVIMDRDGTNRQAVFPDAGSPGLEPQTPIWAPAPLSFEEGDFLAVIYQGNLWLIDAATGKGHQVTSDGLIQKLIWK